MTDNLLTNQLYNVVGCTIQRGIQDMLYSCDGTVSGDGARTTDGSNMPTPLVFPEKFIPFVIKDDAKCLFYGFIPKSDHNIHPTLNYGSFTAVSNEWYLSHQKVPMDIRTTVTAVNPSTYIGQLVGGAGFINKNTDAVVALQRYGHSMVEFLGALWIYGGVIAATGTVANNEVWKSTDNGATWVKQTPTSTYTARYLFGCCVFDGKVVIAGGINGTTYLNTVYTSTDGINFSLVAQSTPAFPTRADFAMVPLSSTKILVCGGATTGGTVSNDFLVASTTLSSWVVTTPLSPDNNPVTFGARQGHRATTCGSSPYVGRVWIIGGNNAAIYYNDVHEAYLDGTTLHIHRVKTNAEFSARSRVCVGQFENTVYVMYGETSATAYAGDVWMCSNLPSTLLAHGGTYVATSAPVFTCVNSSLTLRGVMAASCAGVLGVYISLGRGVTYAIDGVTLSEWVPNANVRLINENYSPTGVRIGRIDTVDWVTTVPTGIQVQQKQFVFDSNNTRQACIDEICTYTKYVQLTFLLDVDGIDEWHPYFYFIPEDSISSLVGSQVGIGTPILPKITITKGVSGDNNLADEDGISISRDYTETVNRVHVAAVDPTTGTWYHAWQENPLVTAGTMIPIDYYFESSDIAPISTVANSTTAQRQAWADAKCLAIYNYFNLDNITFTCQFKDQTYFQLYQEIQFTGFSSSIPTTVMIISDIKYDYAMGSWMTTLTLSYAQKMSDRNMLSRLIGNDFYNEQKDMKDDVFVDLTKISVGLVVTSPVTDGGRRSCNVKLDKDGTIVKCWLLN